MDTPPVEVEISCADEQRLLNVQQVADQLGRSVAWVRQRCAAGEIAYINLGTPKRLVLRFRPAAVEAYVVRLECPSIADPPNPWGRALRGRRRAR